MPLEPVYLDSIKKFEGFKPKAYGDYKQWSVGYGSRARSPSEVIDKTEADRRLNDELTAARGVVSKFAPALGPGPTAALTSLTYNAGSGWTKAGLGQAIQRGDMADAQRRFVQYNKAGGQVLPGLAARRAEEVKWFGATPPAAAPPGAPAPTAAAGQSSMTPAATSPTAMISPEMEAILQRYRSKASPTGRDFSSVGKAIGSLGGMIYDSAQASDAERRMLARETDQRSKMDQMFTGAPTMSPAAAPPAQAKPAPVAPAAAPPSKIEATEPPRFLSPSTPEAVGIATARVDGYNVGSAGGSPMSNFPVAPSAPAGWNGPATAPPPPAAMAPAPVAPLAPVQTASQQTGGMTPEEIRQARVLASMGNREGAMKIMEAARARSTPEYAMKQRIATAEAQIAERKAAGNLTPMEQVQLETAQAELAAKKRELESPSTKLTTLPADATLVSTNPRTGEHQIIAKGQPKVDSTTRKAIYDAQDELPNLKGTLDALDEAAKLLPKIYTGFGAGARSTINQGMPTWVPNVMSDPERAAATQRFDQLMNSEAISAMSQSLKGATTDNEMRAFVKIINDPNTSIETKLQTIQALQRRAQSHYQNKVDRIKELGGRMPDSGKASPAPTPAGTPKPPSQMTDEELLRSLGGG